MKKLAVLCIAALGAALLVFGTAPAASAYPEVTCQVDVDAQVVHPGDTITVTGRTLVAVDSSNHPVPPEKIEWTFVFNGETRTRTGKDVEVMFTAPSVTRTTDFTLTAKNHSPAGDCVHTFNVTVVGPSVAGPHAPAGGGHLPNTGGLPSTGGPAFWVLVAGLVLLLGGGGAVVASRRRS